MTCLLLKQLNNWMQSLGEVMQNVSETLELNYLQQTISDFLVRHSPEEDKEPIRLLGDALTERTLKYGSHLSVDEVENVLGDLDASTLSVIGDEEGMEPIVRREDGALYLRRYFVYEQRIAQAISRRCNAELQPLADSSQQFFQESLRPNMDPGQQIAAALAVHRDFTIISGGPGTGKTRTIVGVLAWLLHINPELNISLAAPTGKAAFRMRESILNSCTEFNFSDKLQALIREAAQPSTIHRLLGSIPNSVNFRHNAEHPLATEYLIVDESSMVDLPLMAKLMDALQEDSRILLVGDPNQLSPVQGGDVFNSVAREFSPASVSSTEVDLMNNIGVESSSLSLSRDKLAGMHVSLSRVHRQEGATVDIPMLCQLVKRGNADEFIQLLRQYSGIEGSPVQWTEGYGEDSVSEAIKTGFLPLGKATNSSQALEAMSQFRILCANNDGKYGVENWNTSAASMISDQAVASPVVVTTNDYSVGLFNGDDGVLIENRAWFRGESGTWDLARSRLPTFLPSYAITIHRSQGSEFDNVVIVLPPQSQVLSRELLYVAISRAKSGFLIVGSEDAIRSALDNVSPTTSGVPHFLRSAD